VMDSAMKIDFQYDQKKLKQFVDECARTGEDALKKLVSLVEGRAKKLAPKRSHNLWQSITSEIHGSKGIVKVTAEYGIFVHEGTGIYGKHTHPIVPTTKKALFWEGAAHPVRSVKGQKANPFLLNALEEIAKENLI